jgi:hypothetical protein
MPGKYFRENDSEKWMMQEYGSGKGQLTIFVPRRKDGQLLDVEFFPKENFGNFLVPICCLA